jgi:hypothetical protein
VKTLFIPNECTPNKEIFTKLIEKNRRVLNLANIAKNKAAIIPLNVALNHFLPCMQSLVLKNKL